MRERERERERECTTTTFSQVVSISLIQQKNNLSKEMYHVVWLKEQNLTIIIGRFFFSLLVLINI